MFYIHLDLSDLLELKDMKKKIEAKAQDELRMITLATHARIVENVQSKLKSTRERYLQALSYSQVSDDTWIINLDSKAMWIEEGKPPGEQIDDLLKSPKAKTAKDGCVLNPRNKVLTSLGWKKIKDIIPGDMVLTHSGKFREVKNLLIQKAGVGTEYVIIKPVSIPGEPNGKNSELVSPSMSLTVDHPVLTQRGWIAAGELQKNDLLATPADLKNLCINCGQPVPINTLGRKTCLNNRCARQIACKEGRIFPFSKEQRRKFVKVAHAKAKAMGVFDRSDWGSRNPETLKKMRDGSARSMRARIRDGKWEPEVFFEKCLAEAGISFEREKPIVTKRLVNAGRGRKRLSTVFLDFYIPELKLAIELDGSFWHNRQEARERDKSKDDACKAAGIRLVRVPSHKIYRRGPRLSKHIKLWCKNHSGELGVAWVKIRTIKRGVVNRPDHIYANKYDIQLEAEEHSFCCETVFIHNSKYLAVPFQHNKNPTAQTQAQNSLTATIKAEMQKRKIPFGKIEKDDQGKPKQGLLHSFSITDSPIKTHQGSGQGHGPIGSVRQGPTGIPFLKGVKVYQKEVVGKSGKKSIQKQIMTFRIVSSKMKGTGRWFHPGTSARNFMDEALEWAKKEFEKVMKDRISAEI